MNKALVLLLSGVAAASLAACHPPQPRKQAAKAAEEAGSTYKTISALNCPEAQGRLKRTAADSDGKSCTYINDRGSEITLTLVDLDGGDAKSTLEPTEAELKALLPPRDSKAAAHGPSEGGGDDVNIDLPGVHSRANDNGARVRVAGVHIDADDDGAKVEASDSDNVVVKSERGKGGVTVDANDQGAEIRAYKAGPGVSITYILASDTPGPEGYRLVGYEARGPSEGPLVVAKIKSRSEGRNGQFNDLKRLITLNVGGGD